MKLIYSYILASILVFIATTIIMLILNQNLQYSMTIGGVTVIAFLIISFIQYLLRSE